MQIVYRKHEQTKKWVYEERIRGVEHATFTPVVLSANGGIAKEANIFYKKISIHLANKWEHSYSSTLQWLRCLLSFSLLRSSIQAIRGARSSIGHAVRIPAAVDLVTSETHLN